MRPEYDSEQLPSWGTIALDHFLLDNWDQDTNATTQHNNLTQEFARMGCKARESYERKAAENTVQPSASQIATVLQPARPAAMRAVVKLMRDQPEFRCVWLRTDYTSDAKHEALEQSLSGEICFGEDLLQDTIILSDARFYDFGDDWTRIHDILPELTGGTPWGFEWLSTLAKEFIDWEAAFLEDPESDELWQDCRRDSESLEEAQRLLYARQTFRLHSLASNICLIIEDSKSHTEEDSNFRVLWLDDRGIMVRQTRLEVQDFCDFINLDEMIAHWEHPAYCDAEIGPDYLRNGIRRPEAAII